MKLRELLSKGEASIGDIVRCTVDPLSLVYKITSGNGIHVMMRACDNGVYRSESSCADSWLDMDWVVVEKNNNNMNLKETVLLALTKEPFKSLRRAKITNGDDMLTDEGRELFINWIFRQNVDKFVADEAIASALSEASKKCQEGLSN